jgi:deoxyribonuclease IV
MSARPFRFGTVGSPISSPKKPSGSMGAIVRLRELELDALELGWVNSVRVSEETCKLIQAHGNEHDIAISVHAPYFINLNANDEEWPKSRKRLMDAAVFGALAGATDVVFHPGSYFSKPPAEVLPAAIARLAGCVEELSQAGIKITLRPETMGKSAMIGSLEDTLLMSKSITGVQPCLDFAHLYARNGDGCPNSFAEWQLLLEDYARALGEQSLQQLHIHISGIEYGPKGERNHLPVKEGGPSFIEVFRALKALGCSGRILCESPEMEADALIMQQAWDEL